MKTRWAMTRNLEWVKFSLGKVHKDVRRKSVCKMRTDARRISISVTRPALMKWAKLLKCQDSQHYFIASPDNESFYTGGGATIKPLKCRELPTFFRCVIRQHVIFKHSRHRVTRRFFCLCVNDMLTRIVTWVPSISNYANKKLLLGAISFSF